MTMSDEHKQAQAAYNKAFSELVSIVAASTPTPQKTQTEIDVENAWKNGKDQGYVKGWNEGYQQGLIDGRNEVRESVERACTDVFGGGRVGGGYFQKPGDGGGGKS